MDEWLTFIDMQIAFLRGVSAEAEEFKLSGTTYVDMDFLESDLLNGYRRSKDLVSDQKQDLNNILQNIDDLVQLEPFQTDTFDTYIDKAEKERRATIDKVNELTEKLTYEYQQSEAVQEHIRNRFEALNNATRRGGQASPIYFDAKAYHNSAAYKMKDSVQHQAKSYLSFKKEQAEKRKIEKLQKELETPNLSLDNYLKIAEEIGLENLTQEQQYIVDQIKASKQQVEIVKGVGAGLWDFTVDTIMGLWYLKNYPLEAGYQTAVALMNPVETYKQIREAIVNSYVQEMVNGNSYTRARWITYATATIATSIVGTKGADKFGKIAWTAGKSKLKDVAGKTAGSMKELANDFRPPRLQDVVAVDGLSVAAGMPANVIHSGKLVDALNSQVESYMFSKGTNRPSWRQSEIDIGNEYPGYRDQVSFKDGTEVSHGTKNSSRPDFYIKGHSLEVKNYNVTTPSGRSNLVRNVSNQVNKRLNDLPGQSNQTVIIDVRGQDVSRALLRQIKEKIKSRTNGATDIIFKLEER